MGPISWMLILTILGAGLVAYLRDPKAARGAALAVAAMVLVISTWMGLTFDPQQGYAFLEEHIWIPSLGVGYVVGVDGISLPLIWVTALLTLLVFIFPGPEPDRRMLALFLVLEAALIGVFAALDLFLFYVAWELVLIPMYFIIHIWGGPRRAYAAIKFFVYTFTASLVMLVGIMAIYFATGAQSFNLLELMETAPLTAKAFQVWVFAALFLGFVVKMPQVPFHTWLPDAHVEAPTEGSALLAGVLLKMGSYGLLRVAMPLLPEGFEAFQNLMIAMGVLSILYAAVVCLAQRDLKRLVAYSSISHMGVVLLGLGVATPAGLAGATFTMVAHGLISPLLFMVSGTVHHGAGTRELPQLGGLAWTAPKTGAVLTAGTLASLGLPGMAQFIGEFLVFWSAFEAMGAWVVLPLLTVVLTAAYYLWALWQGLFGPASEVAEKAHDAPAYEFQPMLALLVLIVLFGVLPGILLGPIDASILQNILEPLRTLGMGGGP